MAYCFRSKRLFFLIVRLDSRLDFTHPPVFSRCNNRIDILCEGSSSTLSLPPHSLNYTPSFRSFYLVSYLHDKKVSTISRIINHGGRKERRKCVKCVRSRDEFCTILRRFQMRPFKHLRRGNFEMAARETKMSNRIQKMLTYCLPIVYFIK